MSRAVERVVEAHIAAIRHEHAGPGARGADRIAHRADGKHRGI